MRPLSLAALLLVTAPAAAQPAQLTADAIKKIKATTVYIRVKVPNGLAVGSGFLVRKDEKTGYIATNDHVAAPSSGKRKGEGVPLPVQGLQVVFNSGTPQEWTAAGVLVARDPERDLATVRFAVPKGKELPEPMSPAGVKATETMPVYICGFPFGESMSEGDKNPEISIGPASVSSVRSDSRGEIKSVQINGALNPGNSGGPVVNAEGKLVGVAVTTIVGAGLGFAVPQHMVKQMMDGRVSEPVIFRTPTGVYTSSVVVDPLNKVKLDRGWIAPISDPTKKSVANVSELPKAFHFLVRGQVKNMPNGELKVAVAEFQLAGNVSEVWLQSAWKDADGNTRKGLAHRTHFASRGGAVPRGGDDDGPGNLPPGFFDDLPGLPPSPGGPGGPFAGPGAPGRSPFGAAPGGPFGGAPKGEGIGPRGGRDQNRPPMAPPAPFGAMPPAPSPGTPNGPSPAATVESSLAQLNEIAADPARARGRRFELLLAVSGSTPSTDRPGHERLTALRPDHSPLVGLRLDAPPDLARQARPRGRVLTLVGFRVERYDPATGEAVALVTVVSPNESAPAGAAPAEEEEEANPARSAPAPQPPAMTAPLTDAAPRPPVVADEGGVSSRVVVIAGLLMLAAVVGVVGVGAAVMYAGQSKKRPRRRVSRDWDDDDEDEDDDRPRRRRR